MRKNLFILTNFIFILANAQMGGLGVYKFLDLPVPSRTSALGGNTIALQDDDFTLSFQNPALLMPSVSNQAAFSIVDYFGDIRHGFTGYARTLPKVGTLAASMQFVNYGTFQSADEYGNIEGTFKAADYSFNLSCARQLDSVISYGLTLKTIYSKYERYTSVGSAADFGLTYRFPKRNLTFGLVLRNFGYQWKSFSGNGREELNKTSQIAICKRVPKAPFRLSLAYQYLEKWNLQYSDPANPAPTEDPFTGEPIKDNKLKDFVNNFGRHLVAGAEIILTKNFNLRLGYNFLRSMEFQLPDRKTLGGFTFGLGVKINKFHLSYAHANYHVAGGSNHFTISCKLSEFIKK